MSNTVNDVLLDRLVTGYADYLVTFIHDFVAKQSDAPGELIPEYAELLARLGVIGARSAVAFVANPLLASGEIDGDALEAQLAVLYDDVPDEALSGMAEDVARTKRAKYLLAAIPDRQDRYGQLYPEEVQPMLDLVSRGAQASDEELRGMLPELEDMWILVQPGIRFHRGDADWAAALEASLEDAVERLHGEDLENHLVQKCLVTLRGTARIKQKAREVLDTQLGHIAEAREELEGQLASLDVQERSIRDKRRALA